MAATEPGENQLLRFIFDELPVRGALVQIGSGWRELLAHREYPDDVRSLLGEAMAAAPLLVSNIKFEGRLSLQAEGDGALKLLLIQITHELEVRGVARHSDNATGRDFSAMLGDGRFGITIERQGGETYQAVVPVTGTRLQDALRGYFQQSEQLPTWLCLVASAEKLSGMMLQRMPAPEDSEEEIGEHWKRLCLLAETLSPDELVQLPAAEILHRLFHEDTLRLFDPQSVSVRCRCSHGRISEMLLSIGKAEIESIIEEKGQVEIECGFCGRQYHYSQAEVLELFDAQSASPPTKSRH